MRRTVGKVAILTFVFAAGFIALGTGSAATSAAWKGVVVAKDPARSAVVTASADGVARTLRAATARNLRVGQAVLVRARLLGDKTYRAQRITPAGRLSKAQLRGVLIAHQRALGRYLVSAGGSVLAVRAGNARSTAGVSGGRDRAGDKVVMTLSLVGGTPKATSVHTVGHTGTLELEGIFLGMTPDGKVRLAVAQRGEVLVTVPAGQTLPALSPGSELQLEVTVDPAGGFTLAQLGESTQATDENDDGQGDDNDDQGATTTTGTTSTTTTTTTTTTDDQGDNNDDQGDDNDDQGDDSGGSGGDG